MVVIKLGSIFMSIPINLEPEAPNPCSICLGEFDVDDEKLEPACNIHTAHKSCLDTLYNRQVALDYRTHEDLPIGACTLCKAVEDITDRRAKSEELVARVVHGELQDIREALEHPQIKTNINLISTTGKTAMTTAVILNKVEVMRLLNEHGADLTTHNAAGAHPVHLAAVHGHIDPMRFLLESGASANITELTDMCPLQWAVSEDKPQIVELLLQYGADPNHREEGGISVMHLAVTKGSWRCIRPLVDHGADINIKSPGKQLTPLHIAALIGNLRMVWVLQDCKADNSTTSGGPGGLTATEIAQARGHSDVTRALVDSPTDQGWVIEQFPHLFAEHLHFFDYS